MDDDDLNPFEDGIGSRPVYLAGREYERGVLEENIKKLIAGGPQKPTPTVLYGPRGVGKTVLLTWMADRAMEIAREKDVELEVLYSFDRDVLPDISGIRRMMPYGEEPGFIKGLGDRIASLALGVRFKAIVFATMKLPFSRVGGKISGRWKGEYDRSIRPSRKRAENALFARCRQRPVLLLVDEAHTYPPEFKKDIIAIAAQAVTEKRDFHLVLAGTPGIKNREDLEDKATYGERAREMPVGGLDEESAKKLISEPFFSKRRITIESEALTAIVREAQRYPYFLQMWAHRLWGHAKTHRLQRIKESDIENIRDKVASDRNAFYWSRYKKIKDPVFLAAHYAAARAVDRQRSLSPIVLASVISEAIPEADGMTAEKAEAFAGKLEASDFLWSPDGVYQPGIPSFMHYLRDRVRLDLPEMANRIDNIQDAWKREPSIEAKRPDRMPQPELAAGRNDPVPGHAESIRRRSPGRHPPQFGGRKLPVGADRSKSADPSGRDDDEGP